MEEKDVIDDVNALLKMGVGDAYRLEHIKQAYMKNKSVWITDSNYLKKLKEKYLVRQSEPEQDVEEGKIHCWKCGKKIELGANFCMACGSALFEVGTETQRQERPAAPKTPRSMKIPVMVGVPVLVVLALGGAYLGGAFDQYMSPGAAPADGGVPAAEPAVAPKPAKDQKSSGCGKGTVLKDGQCVLGVAPAVAPEPAKDQKSSGCGKGTVLKDGQCVLG